MIKNILKTCVLFCVTAIFISCSFLEETRTGSVVFDFSEVRARAAQYSKNSQIEIQLTGDYTAKKIISVKDELICTFAEIPVDAVVQAEATLFYNSLSGLRKDLYSGKSEPVTIIEGENKVEIVLKKIVTVADDEAEYIVKHLQQNPDNDDYTEIDSEVLVGKQLAQTDATAKTYPGFTACEFTNKTINPDTDNPTIIEIKYDRNLHTLTYKGGDDAVTVPAEKEYRYGAKVEVDFTTSVTRTGYDFAGWKDTTSGITYKANSTTFFTMENADVVLMAQWIASSNTRYTVKHLKQNITDDNYTEVTEDREEKTGTSLAQTTAKAKSYTGFTAQAIEQQTIAVDNSTVVEIKYNRNTYTVTYEDSVANETIEVPDDTTAYRYGATVTVDFALGTHNGHTFKGWKNIATGDVYSSDAITSFEMGDDDVILYAQWEANTYTITYELNGGEWAEDYTASSAYHDTYTYGEATSLPNVDKVLLTGYGLTGWYESEDFTGDSITEIAAGRTGNITLYAKWEAGVTNYTIHHFLQNIENEQYTEDTDAEQVVSGKSEETTQAADKVTSHVGFTAKAVTEKTINADGSTFIDVYFDRNVHTVTYNSGIDKVDLYGASISVAGDIPAAAGYRYGATVTVDVNVSLTLQGYKFSGWINESGDTYTPGADVTTFIMDDADTTFMAIWEEYYIDYFIRHQRQSVDGTEYQAGDSQQIATQKTGETTTASAKTYPGFTAKPFTQEIIKPDKSTTVYIYYDRNKYTVVYEDGVEDEQIDVPEDTNEYLYETTVQLNFENVASRTGYIFKGWTTNPDSITPEYTSTGDYRILKIGEGTEDIPTVTLYAVWQMEEQNTGIDVGFGVDTTTISVTESSDEFTASSGYDSYVWKVDGSPQSTTDTLNKSSITEPGVYDITLTATKTVDGKTVTHTWAGQYIKS